MASESGGAAQARPEIHFPNGAPQGFEEAVERAKTLQAQVGFGPLAVAVEEAVTTVNSMIKAG